MRSVTVFIISVVYIFSGIILKECNGLNFPSLCAFNKSEKTCSCYHRTDLTFPIYTADCTWMNLAKFPRDDQLREVEDMDFSHNRLSYLDLYENSFESFTIQSITLAHNVITRVSPNFFENMPNLKRLDLSHNRIGNFVNANIFRGLRNVQILNLSYNRMSTLPEGIFSSLPNLKDLDLSYNYLGALFMETSSFFNSNLGLTANLTSLKMEGLEIAKLHHEAFDGDHDLKYLSLADNPLEEIPAVPYSVEYLDLSGILVTTLSTNDFSYHSLKVLKLNRLQRLKKIEEYAFYNLASLEELHLNDCRKLKAFTDLAFGVIEDDVKGRLKKMFFARSGLRALNSTFLNLFSKMERVDLRSNPWICDCNILWMQDLNETLFADNDLRCLSPSNLLHKKIMELNDKDLPTCKNGNSTVQRILISILGTLVAILAILIIYLVYLGPFQHRNIYRGIGPQSPYNSNTIGIIPTRAENLN